MTTLSEAKKELLLNQDFVQLVDTLKGIAASQFQTLYRGKKRFERFIESFESFFKLVNLIETDSPLVRCQSDVTGIVILTSDEGFMGGLNKKVIHAVLDAEQKTRKRIVVLGTRGADYLSGLGIEFAPLPGVIHETRYEQAVKLKDYLVGEVLEKKMGRVLLAYPNPVSFTIQRPNIIQLLPCDALFKKQEELLISEEQKVAVESSLRDIIEYLAGMWIIYRLYDIFEDSKLAEYAARTMRLEESYDTLKREGLKLRYRYFRCKHELVDKGMRESFSSTLIKRRE